MTAPRNSEIAWSTVRPEENSSLVAFVDACFGLPAGHSLRRTFPVALHPANSDHQFVGRIDEQWVCAATAVVRDWVTSEGVVRAAAVGCFATAARRRGEGWSARLQTVVIERLAREGVQWVALWTDAPELYRGRGFVERGEELHADLGSVRWPRCPEGFEVRRARTTDASELLALHRRHRWRVDRTLDDVRAHLVGECSEVWVIEHARRVRAYAALGKGVDFAGYVADFAGDPELVHVLWGIAASRGAHAVLLPAGSEAFLSGAASDLRGSRQHAAVVRHLAGPDPRRCSWAVHGFDSA